MAEWPDAPIPAEPVSVLAGDTPINVPHAPEMPVSAATAAVEFYALQLLTVELEPHGGRVYQAAEARLQALTKTLTLMLRDYFTAAVWGELRHAPGKCSHSHPCIRGGIGRTDALAEGRAFRPEDIAALGSALFEERWSGGYGGPSWAKIARTVGKYGAWPGAVFIDQCFGLTHNGGAAFDKVDYNVFEPAHNGCVGSHWHTQWHLGATCGIPSGSPAHTRYRRLLDLRHDAQNLAELLQGVEDLHLQREMCLHTLRLVARAGEHLPDAAACARRIASHWLHRVAVMVEQGYELRAGCPAHRQHLALYGGYSPIKWGSRRIDVAKIRARSSNYECDECGGPVCGACGECHECSNRCDHCCHKLCAGCGCCPDDCTCYA